MKINVVYKESNDTRLFRYRFNSKEIHYFHLSALYGVDYEQ